MIGLIILVSIGAIVAAAGAVVAVVGGGTAIGRNANKSLELIPGVQPNVPEHWFGAHETEARLYRRLRDSLRSIQTFAGDDTKLFEIRSSAELHATKLSEQLVACSHLPGKAKEQALGHMESSVTNFEEMAVTFVTKTTGLSGPGLGTAIDDLSIQLEALEAARAEVERIDGTGSTGSTA